MQRWLVTSLCSAGIAAALVLAPASSLAGADDDFRDASAAYRRGDMNAAVKALQRGSESGHVPSMLLLAYIYEQASLDSLAVATYRKAAAAGSTDGEVGLAGMLAAGKGGSRNTAEAVRLYESAAARGNPTAVNALAQAYISGSLGLTAGARDDARAVAAIRAAAEQGYAPAADALARAYARGEFGLAPDPAESARWRDRRAAAGPARAPVAADKATR
jgi:TPR repeat protein